MSTLIFNEYRKRKQVSRAKKILLCKKPKQHEDVKIQVGVVEAEGKRLKRLKGRTLPLIVSSQCNAADLMKAAINKHSKHFRQFNKYTSYTLLYPDHSIEQKLLGSAAQFVLSEYKQELGKPYSKIYFYLCATIDLDRVQDFPDSDSDDYDYDAQNNEKTEIIQLESLTKILIPAMKWWSLKIVRKRKQQK